MNEWIEQRVKMVKEGFSLVQIQRECLEYCLREYNGIFNLNETIYRSMELYSEIIRHSGI